jgi:hypothetical protein
MLFDTKNGGLRKKQPREWHQLAFFLNASFRQQKGHSKAEKQPCF